MPSAFPLSQINRGGRPSIASQPTQLAGVVYQRTLAITHAMQISGGDFTIVPGIPGFLFWPVCWSIQKPSGWSAGYAPTNTSFNLRIGAIATNLATGLTPTVTNTNARIELGVATAALGYAGSPALYANCVGQPLIVNCGAGNGGGSANNASMICQVQYVILRAIQTAP